MALQEKLSVRSHCSRGRSWLHYCPRASRKSPRSVTAPPSPLLQGREGLWPRNHTASPTRAPETPCQGRVSAPADSWDPLWVLPPSLSRDVLPHAQRGHQLGLSIRAVPPQPLPCNTPHHAREKHPILQESTPLTSLLCICLCSVSRAGRQTLPGQPEPQGLSPLHRGPVGPSRGHGDLASSTLTRRHPTTPGLAALGAVL